MATKEVLLREHAQKKILKGVETINAAVSATLGPKGRNVLISRNYGSPSITKDGVTVAKEVELKDPYENMGAQVVREAASKTAEAAGDGTTTATILATDIYTQGLRYTASGANPILIKRGIDKAVSAVVQSIKKQAVKVDSIGSIRSVATVSANWDKEIGGIIADAFEKVGKDGTITVEEAKGLDTTLEVVEGMQFNRGYSSPYFVTNTDEMESVLEDAFVLISENRIQAPQELLPILQAVAKAGKPLLIIAEDYDPEVIVMLVANKMRGNLRVCAVKAPGFGDRRKAILQDIALLVGGTAITAEIGLKVEDCTTDVLGRAKKIVVSKDSTTIIDGAGDKAAIEGRVAQIRKELAESQSEYDTEKLRERLAKLAGGVAILKIGAATEPEMKEKKDRVDDALCATRAAVEEGIVAGGGTALLHAASHVQGMAFDNIEEKMGRDIVIKALESPLRKLCSNAGVEPSDIITRVLNSEGNQGYNVATGNFEDLLVAGVVDPAKVTRCAIQNAASVASLLLTTEVMITEVPTEKKEEENQ